MDAEPQDWPAPKAQYQRIVESWFEASVMAYRVNTDGWPIRRNIEMWLWNNGRYRTLISNRAAATRFECVEQIEMIWRSHVAPLGFKIYPVPHLVIRQVWFTREHREIIIQAS